jgi:hypothetical protein
MLFVAYTAAPFVNYIHLALPVFARGSRQKIMAYAKDLPPNATLYINTMKFTTIPRRTEAQLCDLIPGKAVARPVGFINTNPRPLPWWQGLNITKFYTAEKSKSVRATTTFFPEVWEHVYNQIKRHPSSLKNV